MCQAYKRLASQKDSEISVRHNGDLTGDVCGYIFVSTCTYKAAQSNFPI